MKSSEEIDKDIKGYSERYIRWQGIRITQMGFINNLFMGLAVGSLVWLGNYILIKEHSANVFFLLSSLLFAISLLLGFLTAWNRLKDFRLTAQINRSLVEDPSAIAVPETKSKRRRMRTDATNLGETSWKLLRCNIFCHRTNTDSGGGSMDYLMKQTLVKRSIALRELQFTTG